MSKFNIGDKVMAKNSSFFGEEVGVLVGIDTREGVYGKYLVKFNSLGISEGFGYGMFRNRPDFIIKPYEGYATWLNDLIKVEDECKGEICMSKFNIGDRVVSKGYPHLGEEVGVVVGIDIGAEADDGKYLVKFNSLDTFSGWEYGIFRNDPNYLGESYEGYADWVNEDDLVKVEEECEEEKCKEGEICMSEFNIGDKVISKGYPNLGEEVGIIVGIDLRKESNGGKYLVKFNSLDMGSGWVYGVFRNDLNLIIEPYEGYAEWVNEDDLVKVEDKCKENECEEECEEDIRTKFESVRKQKEEIVKEKSKKVLELTLEIKEIEREIEKIKKEWHLD